MPITRIFLLALTSLLLCAACGQVEEVGPPVTLLKGGTVYSGENMEPLVTDLWLQADRIVAVGAADDLVADDESRFARLLDLSLETEAAARIVGYLSEDPEIGPTTIGTMPIRTWRSRSGRAPR